jgi:hypothetical protein
MLCRRCPTCGEALGANARPANSCPLPTPPGHGWGLRRARGRPHLEIARPTSCCRKRGSGADRSLRLPRERREAWPLHDHNQFRHGRVLSNPRELAEDASRRHTAVPKRCAPPGAAIFVATVSATTTRFSHAFRPKRPTEANPTPTRSNVTLSGVQVIALLAMHLAM